MAHHKLALIRYKIIDECLSNPYREWTLKDLIDKVSEGLYEYEGIDSGVSKRTIQADLQTMRSDKLGYNAPIIVQNRKYYTYSDKNYSIRNTAMKPKEVAKMKEVISILKQLSAFSYFEEMSEMLAKLENHLYKESNQSRNCIQFESNKKLKGFEYINPLYQAILNQKTLYIEYQSFKAKQAQEFTFYPYLLKEYRNRWFLIGVRKHEEWLITLALDRIIKFKVLEDEEFVMNKELDFDEYYADLIGVTKSEKDQAQEVILELDPYNAPYVLTKPFHPSQEILETKADNTVIVKIEVILNFELEREILGFGNGIKVLAPKLLIHRIKRKLRGLQETYNI